MRLSTKGRFAVTAMIDVGLREKAGPVSLNDIAMRHHISMSYLEQLFARLRRAGLVESTRGPGGGYTLARRAGEISVADIIAAVETGQPEGEERDTSAAVPSHVAAMTAQLWSELNARMQAYMQSITLQALIDEQRAQGVVVETEPAHKLQRGIYRRAPERPLKPAPLAANSVFDLGRLALGGR
jgi:Rrf2 family iron-sulfur cluster assembly transcriptional regulator